MDLRNLGWGERTLPSPQENQHRQNSYSPLFDLHEAVRSTATLKQTCEIKQELTVQISLFPARVLNYETRQTKHRDKKFTAKQVFHQFCLRVEISKFQWPSPKYTCNLQITQMLVL